VSTPSLSVPFMRQAERLQLGRYHWRSGRRSAIVGIILAILMLGMATVGPLLYPVSPDAQHLTERLHPPVGFGGTWDNPLGTDALGRNILARVIAGARVSLAIGILAVLTAGIVGSVLGIIGGSRSKLAAAVVTWLTDLQAVLPFIVVAIASAAVLGQGIPNVLVILIVTGWVVFARVIRLQTKVLQRSGFVEASRAMGSSSWWRATHHLLPGLTPALVVLLTQQLAAMILYEGALTFLGLGVGPRYITWGGMASDGLEASLRAPWVVIIPGLAIGISALSANLIGDSIQTAGAGR